jgi:hypothetical protein
MPELKIVEHRDFVQGATGAGMPGGPFAFPGEKISLDTKKITDSNSQEVLQKRARRKAISKALALALHRTAKSGRMKRAYWRTASECCEMIKQADGTLTSRYCWGRWCAVCGAIRQAVMTEKYKPVLRQWEDKCFLTLTVKSCSATLLRPTLRGMAHSFRMAVQHARRKHPGVQIRAIRSLEVTFNEGAGFHPHYHCIVEGKGVAKTMLSWWVRNREDAGHMGQDLRPVTEGFEAELFKYCVKLATTKKGADGKLEVAPVWALNEIYGALYRMKQVQGYGIALPEAEEEELEVRAVVSAFKDVDEKKYFDWWQAGRDWFSTQTGELLTDYSPSNRMEDFITKLERL